MVDARFQKGSIATTMETLAPSIVLIGLLTKARSNHESTLTARGNNCVVEYAYDQRPDKYVLFVPTPHLKHVGKHLTTLTTMNPMPSRIYCCGCVKNLFLAKSFLFEASVLRCVGSRKDLQRSVFRLCDRLLG